MDTFYTDKHQWLLDQATALDEGRFNVVDRLRLTQVIEGMAQDDYDHASNLMAWIIEHLFELMIDDCVIYCRDRKHWKGAIAGYRVKLKAYLRKRQSMKKHGWQWNAMIDEAYQTAYARFNTEYAGNFDSQKITPDFRFHFDDELLNEAFYPQRPECEEECRKWQK